MSEAGILEVRPKKELPAQKDSEALGPGRAPVRGAVSSLSPPPPQALTPTLAPTGTTWLTSLMEPGAP